MNKTGMFWSNHLAPQVRQWVNRLSISFQKCLRAFDSGRVGNSALALQANSAEQWPVTGSSSEGEWPERLGKIGIDREAPLGLTWPWWIVVILVLGWLFYGWSVADRGLWSAHEGRAAQNAQSVLDGPDWWFPHLFTGEPETQKPPLYYWMVAGVSCLRQEPVDAWSVRLPAVLAGLLGLVAFFWFARQVWDTEAALAAVLILATCTRFAWLARVARIDLPLTAIVILLLGRIWWAEAKGSTRSIGWWWHILMAAGILLKGPVLLILVWLPIGFTWCWRRQPFVPGLHNDWYAVWQPYRPVRGCLLAFGLSLPWFVAVTWATDGAFFSEFFIYHNLHRALGTEEALKSGPFWFYLPRVVADMFPWSFLFLPMLYTFWQRRQQFWDPKHVWHRTLVLPLMWCLSHFLFLSLVSFKRPDYLAPAIPAVVLLLTGWLLDRRSRFEIRQNLHPPGNLRRRRRWIFATAVGCVTLAGPLLIWGLERFCKRGIVNKLFEWHWLAQHFNETDRFMMAHVEDVLRTYWILLAVLLTVSIGCLWTFHTGWHQRRHWQVLFSLAVPWMVAFGIQIHLILPAVDPLREMSRFAGVIRTLAPPEEPIIYFGKFDPDLMFHAGKPAVLIGDWEQLVAQTQTRQPKFIVIRAKHLEWVRRDPKLADWVILADNYRHTPVGDHREPRILMASRPTYQQARRLRTIR